MQRHTVLIDSIQGKLRNKTPHPNRANCPEQLRILSASSIGFEGALEVHRSHALAVRGPVVPNVRHFRVALTRLVRTYKPT